IVFVGDTLHDLEVSEALGVTGVLLTGGHTSEKRLRARTSRIFTSFPELENWLLKRINGAVT
ncbi:MAG: HAD family hydrolase, partial [Fidelibacterota bacterium]